MLGNAQTDFVVHVYSGSASHLCMWKLVWRYECRLFFGQPKDEVWGVLARNFSDGRPGWFSGMVLRSAGGTLCIPGQVCLLSRYSLVLTCLCYLEIEEEQLYPFRARWRLRPSS